MTPKEFNFYAEYFTEKMERESKEKLEFAWLSAYWQRVDNLHPLDHYLKKAEQPEQPKQMTPEEMMLKVYELNAKMGGTVVKPGGED